MSATSALMAGRRAAERLMVDTIVITRLAGETTDPERGTVAKTYTTLYSGPGKIQRSQRASRVSPVTVAEAEVFESRLEVHLPVSATGITSDDIVTVTASLLDPDLVGAVFHVREPAAKTWQTALRFGIVQVTS